MGGVGGEVIKDRDFSTQFGSAMDKTPIRLEIEPLDEGGFVATSPDVPGLVVDGQTVEEVIDIAQSLVPVMMESYLEHGDPAPPVLQRRMEAFADLRELRKSLPKLSREEIVATVRESREDLA
jgi:antitoxin HicB